MRELKLSYENTIVHIPDLNSFSIGDQVIADGCADHDRFEGVVIGIELRRVYGADRLEPCITLLHEDCITDEFKPNDLRKVGTPAPEVTTTGDDVKPRSRMQLSPGYLNSFETVISALEIGGEQAQSADYVAHGACLLHAAVELRHVWTERKGAALPPQNKPVTIEEHNAAFDLANAALGGAFKDGFREGWLFTQDPSFDDREDLERDYHHVVDIAPSECWDAYREKYFAMLPLAEIPEVSDNGR